MEDIFGGNDTQVNKLQNGGEVEVQAAEVGSELMIEDGDLCKNSAIPADFRVQEPTSEEDISAYETNGQVILGGVEIHLERLQFGSKPHVSTAQMVEKNAVEMGVLKQISANVAAAETLSQFPGNTKQVEEEVFSLFGSPQVILDAGHKDLGDSTREASFMDHEKASMNTPQMVYHVATENWELQYVKGEKIARKRLGLLPQQPNDSGKEDRLLQ